MYWMNVLVTDVPLNGFNYPYMAPGGAYGSNWWQLDGSLNVAGAKWTNQKFVEDIMRGFAEVQAQNPDGRIDLWGGSQHAGRWQMSAVFPDTLKQLMMLPGAVMIHYCRISSLNQ